MKSNILNLLNKARYYHNISCKDERAIGLCDKVLRIDPENIDAMLIKVGSLDCSGREKESFLLIKK